MVVGSRPPPGANLGLDDHHTSAQPTPVQRIRHPGRATGTVCQTSAQNTNQPSRPVPGMLRDAPRTGSRGPPTSVRSSFTQPRFAAPAQSSHPASPAPTPDFATPPPYSPRDVDGCAVRSMAKPSTSQHNHRHQNRAATGRSRVTRGSWSVPSPGPSGVVHRCARTWNHGVGWCATLAVCRFVHGLRAPNRRLCPRFSSPSTTLGGSLPGGCATGRGCALAAACTDHQTSDRSNRPWPTSLLCTTALRDCTGSATSQQPCCSVCRCGRSQRTSICVNPDGHRPTATCRWSGTSALSILRSRRRSAGCR